MWSGTATILTWRQASNKVEGGDRCDQSFGIDDRDRVSSNEPGRSSHMLGMNLERQHGVSAQWGPDNLIQYRIYRCAPLRVT